MESSNENVKQENTNEGGSYLSSRCTRRSLRERASKVQIKSPKNSQVHGINMPATNSSIANSWLDNSTQLKDISLCPSKPLEENTRSDNEFVDSDVRKYHKDLDTSPKSSAASIISSECSSENCDTLQSSHETYVSNQKGRVTDEIGPDGVWKVRTYTGYIVTLHINLNLGKPPKFYSESAEVMWHTANEINMKRLKHQIQRGEYFPNDAIIELDPSPLQIPELESGSVVLESEEKRREKLEAWESFKVAALQKEVKVVESVITLQECFSECEPRLEKGLEVLDTFPYLELTNLMLKKYPCIVYTLQNLCTYEQLINDQPDSTRAIIKEVREKAKSLYSKIQSIFNSSSSAEFEDKFKEQYSLLWTIYGFSTKRIQEIVKDPTLQIL